MTTQDPTTDTTSIETTATTTERPSDTTTTDTPTTTTKSQRLVIKKIKDISVVPGDRFEFTEFQDKLYFRADDGVNGKELWVTDGTESGTELVKNIQSGQDLSSFMCT